jgi:uncharacterized protein (DUF1015 family)
MALIYPFQGYRYNKEAVGNLDLVVTQPYDKITPAMQEEYYRRSAYNAVRVTFNLEKRENPDTDYADAGATYKQWLNHQILVQDPTPAIYAYYQEYEIDGQKKLQRGFIALLDLGKSGSGIIPHESTLAEPKQDRLRLMRRLESNDDLVFLLYADAKLAVNRIIDENISARRPEMETRDDYGVIHRVWAIARTEALEEIQEIMKPQELFIADGHHRFETSLNYMKECRKKKWETAGVESFDKRMVACFNSIDGVTILSTHRLIRDLPSFDSREFLRKSEKHFTSEYLISTAALWTKMKEERKNHVFGFYAGSGRFILLRLKPDAMQDPLLMKHAEAYRQLDVSLLHALLLESCLGIDAAKLAAQTNVDYERERDICVKLVDNGKYQAAFFLNPTTAEQMQHVASLGERMPQKSTDFYPKLLTGLIFHKFKIKKNK